MVSIMAFIAAGVIAVPANAATRNPELPAASDSAAALVRRAIDALGGEHLLRSVESLRLTGVTSLNRLGDSDWPEGPFLEFTANVDELRDLQRGVRRIVQNNHGHVDAPPGVQTQIEADGRTIFFEADGTQSYVTAGENTWQLLDPVRLLFTVLDRGTLTLHGDTMLRRVQTHVVGFTWEGAPARLYLDAGSGYPRMVEFTQTYPRDIFWNAWGDVMTRIRFSLYYRESNGMRYPRQVDEERNGQPFRKATWQQVVVNPEIDTELLPSEVELGDDVQRLDMISDSVPLGKASEVAEGIIQFVGRWNVMLVRQRDGLVIVEAPISSGYSNQVLAEAERRFPGVTVKAVITTTDFWWHIAGLREYAARGIPIHVLSANRGRVDQLLRAPHTMRPDALIRSAAPVRLVDVSERGMLGEATDPNRIELIPFNTVNLDRMLLTWLPAKRLVYTAEAVQIYGGEVFFPQTAIEAVETITGHGLDPVTLTGMHLAAMPFEELLRLVPSEVSRPR